MAEILATDHKLAAVEPTNTIGALFESQYRMQEKRKRSWIFMYLMHLIIVILVELSLDAVLRAAELRAWVVLAVGILALAVVTSERAGMGNMTLVSHKNRYFSKLEGKSRRVAQDTNLAAIRRGVARAIIEKRMLRYGNRNINVRSRGIEM